MPFREILRRFYFNIAFIIFVLGTGTIGYTLLEDYTPFEAFYMTVYTITTVGFGELKSLHTTGRILTIFLIFTGVGVTGYTLIEIVNLVVNGDLRERIRKLSMKKAITALKNHVIIFGIGGVGIEVAKDLQKRGVPFVVVDHSSEAVSQAKKQGFLHVDKFIDNEEALISAGVKDASVLVLTTNKDEINIFLTLAAKDINPKIRIISRVNSVFNEDNIARAGADEIVSVPRTAGQKIAALI